MVEVTGTERAANALLVTDMTSAVERERSEDEAREKRRRQRAQQDNSLQLDTQRGFGRTIDITA